MENPHNTAIEDAPIKASGSYSIPDNAMVASSKPEEVKPAVSHNTAIEDAPIKASGNYSIPEVEVDVSKKPEEIKPTVSIPDPEVVLSEKKEEVKPAVSHNTAIEDAPIKASGNYSIPEVEVAVSKKPEEIKPTVSHNTAIEDAPIKASGNYSIPDNAMVASSKPEEVKPAVSHNTAIEDAPIKSSGNYSIETIPDPKVDVNEQPAISHNTAIEEAPIKASGTYSFPDADGNSVPDNKSYSLPEGLVEQPPKDNKKFMEFSPIKGQEKPVKSEKVEKVETDMNDVPVKSPIITHNMPLEVTSIDASGAYNLDNLGADALPPNAAPPVEVEIEGPLSARLVHKQWKARAGAYKELMKGFEDGSIQFGEFEALLPKIAIDGNPIALDDGLGAILAYVSNCPTATSTMSPVITSLINKAFLGRPSIKTKATDICLMYMEVDTPGPVVQKLIEGFTNKNGKIVSHCVFVLTQALKAFGSKVFTVKPVLKEIKSLFESSDRNVRKEATNLMLELFRWLGPMLNTYLEELRPAQVKELKTAFDKQLENATGPAVPERYLRSQTQSKTSSSADGKAPAKPVNAAGWDPTKGVNIMTVVDFEGLKNSKWNVKKAALNTIIESTSGKFYGGKDFIELIRVLKELLGDSHQMIVQTTCLTIDSLANGLGSDFRKASLMLCNPLLEILKEKKASVVAAAHSALVKLVTGGSVAFGDVLDMFISATNHKVAKMRQQTLSVMKTIILDQSVSLGKSLDKCGPIIVKNFDDPTKEVRTEAAKLFGAYHMRVDEVELQPYFDQLDRLKQEAVKKILVDSTLVATEEPAAAQNVPSKSKKIPPPSPRVQKKVTLKKSSSSLDLRSPSKKPSEKPTTESVSSGMPSLRSSDGISKEGRTKRDKRKLSWTVKEGMTEDTVSALKSDMSAYISPELLGKMYSNDFKKHVSALAELAVAVYSCPSEAIECADLLLKWCALRITEDVKNPTALVKTLEFIDTLIKALTENGCHLTEHDAREIVPALLERQGHGMERIRNSVKKLITGLTQIYPVTRVFSFSLEALKSRNIRSRVEALEIMKLLINKHGLSNVTACAKSIPLISVQVNERDSSVRIGALEVLVEVYGAIGEEIWKHCKMSDSSKDMLVKKLKQSGQKSETPLKRPKTAAPRLNRTKSNRPATPLKTPIKPVTKTQADIYSLELDDLPARDKRIAKLTTAIATSSPVLESTRLPFEMQEESTPTLPARITADIASPLAKTSPSNDKITGDFFTIEEEEEKENESEKLVGKWVEMMSSENVEDQISGLRHIESIAMNVGKTENSQESQALISSADSIVQALGSQLALPFDMTDSATRHFKHITSTIAVFFGQPTLARPVSYSTLNWLCRNMIMQMCEESRVMRDSGKIVAAANVAMGNLLSNCNRAHAFRVMLDLLTLPAETPARRAKAPGLSRDFVKLVGKCLSKLTDSALKSKLKGLNVPEILKAANEFFESCLEATWPGNDTGPISNVKKIISGLTKVAGPKVMKSYLQTASIPKDSFMQNYISRVIDSDQKALNTPTRPATAPHPSPALHPKKEEDKENSNLKQKLTDIFTLIGKPPTSSQGIEELYKFQKSNPSVDIEPAIRTTSETFQGYIRRGLKRAADRDKLKEAKVQTVKEESATNTASHYLSRLREMQAKINSPRIERSERPKTALSSTKSSEVEVDLLKAKLATLKKGFKQTEEQQENVAEQNIPKPVQPTADLTSIKARLQAIKTRGQMKSLYE